VDGGELGIFGLGGPFLRFNGCDNSRIFFYTNTFEGSLGGFDLVGGLVFGAQPADEAVAFFGGAITKDDRLFYNAWQNSLGCAECFGTLTTLICGSA
jgi:hypothetical protein